MTAVPDKNVHCLAIDGSFDKLDTVYGAGYRWNMSGV